MGGRQAMIVAGLGCRRGCPADAIVALVQQAWPVDMLAAPDWKRDEAGLLEAARLLGLPLTFIAHAPLAAAQAHCVTHSAVASRAVGMASVAEAAALAGGGTLLRPRFGTGPATCATATHPRPASGGGSGGADGGGPRPPTPLPSPLPLREGPGEGWPHSECLTLWNALDNRLARGTPPRRSLPQGAGETLP